MSRPIGAPQPKAAGLDRHQRRRLLLGCSQATSHSEVVDRHTHLARFAEIWIASLAPTFLVGYQFASRRRTASQVLGARRSLPSPCFARGRSFPPGTGRPSSGPLGNGAGSDGHGALESTSVGSPVVEHKTDGDLSYVMETMSPTNKIWSREAGAAEKRDIIPFSLGALDRPVRVFRMQPETAEGSAALPPRRAKRLSAIPITVGYRLHGER